MGRGMLANYSPTLACVLIKSQYPLSFKFLFCMGEHSSVLQNCVEARGQLVEAFSFYRVDPGDRTQVARFGSPSPLSHLAGPHLFF